MINFFKRENKLETAVIMAGGAGTRLSSITGKLPKPMVNIRNTARENYGKAKDTILEHQIKVLHENGINNFILVVGNKKEYIEEAFTSEIINANLGCNDINITFYEEIAPLGTAGAFCSKDLQDLIGKQSFLFTYADVLFDVNIQDMYRYYKQEKADAAVLISPCSEPDDRPLCVFDKNGEEIVDLIPKQGKEDGPRGSLFPNTPKNGLMILNDTFFEILPEMPTYIDMEENVLSKLIFDSKYSVVGWNTPCYIKDIGTINRYYEGVMELEKGDVELKNPNKFSQTGVVFKSSDILQVDENGNLFANKNVAEAITILNKNGVITVVQDDIDEERSYPNLSEKDLQVVVSLQDRFVDTLLVRSCGAYANAKIDDLSECKNLSEQWNIDEKDLFCFSSSENGCFITKLDGSNYTMQVSSFEMAATAVAERHYEMQKTQQGFQLSNFDINKHEDFSISSTNLTQDEVG